MPSSDRRQIECFRRNGGKVEHVIDALINITRNVAVDGDDGWEYALIEEDIEMHPATLLDQAFDIARFKCINQGGGEGQSRGPYRDAFELDDIYGRYPDRF